jgi:hypothetical protein
MPTGPGQGRAGHFPVLDLRPLRRRQQLLHPLQGVHPLLCVPRGRQSLRRLRIVRPRVSEAQHCSASLALVACQVPALYATLLRSDQLSQPNTAVECQHGASTSRPLTENCCDLAPTQLIKPTTTTKLRPAEHGRPPCLQAGLAAGTRQAADPVRKGHCEGRLRQLQVSAPRVC